ncbi:MAG: hypothetical protein M3406_07985 [Chloroflexota bacterium]|nr:hypothetical protein [Chloroflexota bacterium]
MSGASRLLIALAVAGSGVLLGGSPASGNEDGTQVLPGEAVGAVTGDVDGDEVRELVRVVVDPVQPEHLLLEAWSFDGAAWTILGSTPATRRDEDGAARQLIVNATDGFALLAWSDGDGQHVLFLTAGNLAGSRSCCLTIARVAMDGNRLIATPLGGGPDSAEMVTIADFEDDGIEELVATEVLRDSGDARVRVLRWDGVAFEQELVAVPSENRLGLPLAAIGDSDGLAGDEIVFGPMQDGGLVRLAGGADGQTLVEEIPGTAMLGAPGGGYIWSATAGLMIGTTQREIQLVRWPRGQAMEIVASLHAPQRFALSVLGEGEDAVIVDGNLGFFGQSLAEAFVYDLELALELEVPPRADMDRFMDLTTDEFPALGASSDGLAPFNGPLEGGLGDGRHAYFAAGNAILLDEGGELTFQPTNGLVGRIPLGVAGPGHEWMAVSSDWIGTRDLAYLYPSRTLSSITLTPLSTVLADATSETIPAPEVVGAVLVEGSDGKRHLKAPDGGFAALIDAPSGSSVTVAAGPYVVFEGEVAEGPLTVPIEPGRQTDGNQAFGVAIMVITPAGAASTVSWEAEILRERPQLTTSAQTDAFALSSTVIGRAPDGATLTVDGELVEPSAFGGFRAEVSAPIWPRDVVVVARDPVGNETVRRIEVVGFLDYRGLPWLPIVGVVTVGLGFLLFLRTPGRRQATMVVEGDGRLEEMDVE